MPEKSFSVFDKSDSRNQLPGLLYSLDDQCRQILGNSSNYHKCSVS